MQVTAALAPSSPTSAIVAAEPLLEVEVAAGADETTPTRVDSLADAQPVVTASQPPASPASSALSSIHDRVAAALATGNDGTGGLTPKVQRELAYLLALLPHVAVSGDPLLL